MNQNQTPSGSAQPKIQTPQRDETGRPIPLPDAPPPPQRMQDIKALLEQISDPNCPEPTRAALIKQLQAL